MEWSGAHGMDPYPELCRHRDSTSSKQDQSIGWRIAFTSDLTISFFWSSFSVDMHEENV
jgi:hypothetical protein